MGQLIPPRVDSPDHSWIWANALASKPPTLDRPREVPLPESIAEVSRWAGSEDSRRVELVYAPVFWVFLPLAAIGFLIFQTVADPTGSGWSITINGENRDTWPGWVPPLAWVGVSVWLLVAVGVLLFRLSLLRDLHAENEWIFAHGVAHSIHRASADYDDGEARWATYIALDHRLDEEQASRIHAAFEAWLAREDLPPSGSKPISSQALFGAQAAGGYFILRLPVSAIAGTTAEQQWMLITEPRENADSSGGVIITPVPVPKKLERIRRKLLRRAERRAP
ncbi:hypothetical protein [Leucobacter sp. GX24907]